MESLSEIKWRGLNSNVAFSSVNLEEHGWVFEPRCR